MEKLYVVENFVLAKDGGRGSKESKLSHSLKLIQL